MLGISTNNFKPFSKLKEMYMTFYPCLSNFPRKEHMNGLVGFIDNHFNDAMVSLIKANKIKSKRKFYLEEAESSLIMLNIRLNLCLNRKYITEGHYALLEEKLIEIGGLISEQFKTL